RSKSITTDTAGSCHSCFGNYWRSNSLPNRVSLSGTRDERSAGSLGCGNDFVEALVTAQIITAWIEAEIAMRRRRSFSGKRRNFFELLERAAALAGPRVN